MQLFMFMASIWPSTLLLLWLLTSPANAATKKLGLNSISSNPKSIYILELDNANETINADDSYYTADGDGGIQRNYCDTRLNLAFVAPVEVDGNYYVGCCVAGSNNHLSGDTTKGFMCCGPGTDRSGNATTGYACCPAGQDPKGDIAGGKFICCDKGLEATADQTGALACCPAGKHVSGTVAGNNFLCCDPNTEYQSTAATGAMCCKDGESPQGDMNTGYTCCPEGQHVSGKVGAGYLCCGDNHSRAVDSKGNDACCPDGYTYEDSKCKPPVALCANGKQMVNGQCVCPSGTIEQGGNCIVPPPPPPVTGAKACDSGILTGHCYEIFGRDGRMWGWNAAMGAYSQFPASEENAHNTPGKFQFCEDPDCSKDSPIDPTTGFSIRDIRGIAPAGSRKMEWLDGLTGGGHITKTPDYSAAGRFSITKWPCGKYCLGGAAPKGLSATCPSDTVGISFSGGDPQACLEVTVNEVPCDIRDLANNCVWKTPANQCCGSPVGGPIDCSGSSG